MAGVDDRAVGVHLYVGQNLAKVRRRVGAYLVAVRFVAHCVACWKFVANLRSGRSVATSGNFVVHFALLRSERSSEKTKNEVIRNRNIY